MSAFASDFNPHPFGHCVIFSGKTVTAPPPKSEGARTPMFTMEKDVYHKLRYLDVLIYNGDNHLKNYCVSQENFHGPFNQLL